MKALADFLPEVAASLRGLLFDLDDTLLSHGTLTRDAYSALWDLHDAGLRLVAVTGRPSGWGELLVRQWPIDGAVTENGAVSIVRDGANIVVRDACDEVERSKRARALRELVDRVKRVVPEASLSDDARARRSDITWDVGERVKLPEERVELIVKAIQRAGSRSHRSSIHLHATYDGDDKASGALTFLYALFGEDPGSALSRYAFVGDSGNDAACFSAFNVTFGVANVLPYVSRLAIPPRFLAKNSMGDGFTEIATALLRAREAASASAMR